MTDRLLLDFTCGTSLLTNGANAGDRVWLTAIAIVNAHGEGLKSADEPTRPKMSAELRNCGSDR